MIFHFAYLDPGTGSLFLQAIIGIILGSIVFFRGAIKNSYYKVKSVFSRKSQPDEEK